MKIYWKDTAAEILLTEIVEKGFDWVFETVNPEYSELVASDDHVRFKLTHIRVELTERSIQYLDDDDVLEIEQETIHDLRPASPIYIPTCTETEIHTPPVMPSYTTTEIRIPPMDYADYVTQDFNTPRFTIERAEDAPNTSNPDNAPFVVVRSGDRLRKEAAAEHKYSKQAALLASFGYNDMVLNKRILEDYDGDVVLAVRDLIKACS